MEWTVKLKGYAKDETPITHDRWCVKGDTAPQALANAEAEANKIYPGADWQKIEVSC